LLETAQEDLQCWAHFQVTSSRDILKLPTKRSNQTGTGAQDSRARCVFRY
jgi:hypothetical protein